MSRLAVSERRTPVWLLWGICFSFAFHGGVYVVLGAPRSADAVTRPPVTMEFIAVTASPTNIPAPPPAPVAAPPPERALRREPITNLADAKPAPPMPEPSAETVDLSGVTLTNEVGSFVMHAGNGLARDGVRIQAGSAGTRTGTGTLSGAALKAESPSFVALSDLSARPSPPALDAALQRHYPETARRRAMGGTASVRARIDPDGVVRVAMRLSESFAGFGDACLRTLRGSRWSAPRDRRGNAVATEIRYTCRFLVQP